MSATPDPRGTACLNRGNNKRRTKGKHVAKSPFDKLRDATTSALGLGRMVATTVATTAISRAIGAVDRVTSLVPGRTPHRERAVQVPAPRVPTEHAPTPRTSPASPRPPRTAPESAPTPAQVAKVVAKKPPAKRAPGKKGPVKKSPSTTPGAKLPVRKAPVAEK